MNKLIAPYNIRARLYPSLLLFLPLLFGMLAWAPDIKKTIEPLTGGVISAGLLFLLVSISREAGKKAEKGLIQEWGGFLPSVLFLQHKNSTLERTTKARYHAKLQNMVPEIKMPSAEQEAKDSQWADDQYLSCCRFLLAKTRDGKDFALLKEQNMEYGFRRNLYGLRPYGIFLSALGILLCAAKIGQDYVTLGTPIPWALFCLVACGLCLCAFVFIVTKFLVRSGADAYALSLLEALDKM